jgi:pimeloyl-ACP methyl ester carboxylesterase
MTEMAGATGWPEPRASDVTHDGVRLRVLEWGPDDGPAVVVLHGFTGHARQAQFVAPTLADRYRVIAIDQRGHGDSDRAPVYGTVPMTADLMAVLDALGIDRAALVGHSLGGMVGLSAVAQHPDRFTHLVLGDIGPEPAPAGVARIQAGVAERHVFADLDDAVAAQAALSPTADPEALRHRVAHNLAPTADGRWTWKYDPALRDRTAPFENHPPDTLWAFLAAVTVPVLLLRGEVSDICTAETAERMRAANPRLAVVTIPGAGHSIATDAPAAVATAVADFLA